MNLRMYAFRAPLLSFIFLAILSSAAGSDFWCPTGNPVGYATLRSQIEANSRGYTFCTAGATLYRSADSGRSWQALFFSQDGQYSALGNAGDDALILVNAEMRRSTDDGESWTVITPYSGFPGLNRFKSTSTGTIAIPSGDSVYISRDRGDTWQYKIFAVDNLPGHFRKLSEVLVADNGDLYAQCSHYTEESGGSPVVMPDELYVLKKDSPVWVQILLPGNVVKLVPLAVDNDGDIYAAVDSKQIGHFNPVNQSWVVTAPGFDSEVEGCLLVPDGRFYVWTVRGLYQATDKGANWQRMHSGLPRDYFMTVRDLAVSKDLTVYASTMYHGFFRLPPQKGAWRPIGADIGAIPVEKLLVAPKGNRLFATSFFNGFHRSDDGGTTWQRMPLQRKFDGSTALTFPAGEIVKTTTGTLYAAAGAEGIFKSENNGDSWSHIVDVWSSTASLFFKTLAVAADGSLIALCMSNNSIFYTVKSADGGATWTTVLNGGNHIIRGGGEMLFLCTDYILYRSANHGDSWEPVPIPGVSTDFYIYDMLYTRDNRFFLATSEGVWLSTDNGANWSVYGLHGSACTALLYTARGHMLVAANHHILRTEDQGTTWQDITSNLPNSIYGITTLVEDADGWMYAGGDIGVFKNCVASSVEEQVSAPPAAPLLSCFPNPASECITVSYQLTAPAHVSVKVVDMTGKEVAVLVNEWKPAGAHTCEWKDNLAQGMYLVVIDSGAEPVSYPVYCR